MNLNRLRDMEDQVAEAMSILNSLEGHQRKRRMALGEGDEDEDSGEFDRRIQDYMGQLGKRMGALKGNNLNRLEGDLDDAMGLFGVSFKDIG